MGKMEPFKADQHEHGVFSGYLGATVIIYCPACIVPIVNVTVGCVGCIQQAPLKFALHIAQHHGHQFMEVANASQS
jgi:hypothetical protein